MQVARSLADGRPPYGSAIGNGVKKGFSRCSFDVLVRHNFKEHGASE
jgi:hypothetical protein